MKRTTLLPLLLICITTLIFPGKMPGLRHIGIGDKLPVTDELKVLAQSGNKMVLYLKSSDIKSTAFLKITLKQLQHYEKINKENTPAQFMLYIIDADPQVDQRVTSLLQSVKLKAGVKITADPQRTIYGQLGVIIVPSLLFVTGENTLHSLAAGLKKNLGMFVHEYLTALIKGKPATDVYKTVDQARQDHRIVKLENQAFKLMISGDYTLANTMYRKALKDDPHDIEAQLGTGYSMLLMGNTQDALDYFTTLQQQEKSKRVSFAHQLCLLIQTPPADQEPEPYDQLVKLAHLEPNFFMATYKAAEILMERDKCQLSNTLFQHSYQLLLRNLRRSKTK